MVLECLDKLPPSFHQTRKENSAESADVQRRRSLKLQLSYVIFDDRTPVSQEQITGLKCFNKMMKELNKISLTRKEQIIAHSCLNTYGSVYINIKIRNVFKYTFTTMICAISYFD